MNKKIIIFLVLLILGALSVFIISYLFSGKSEIKIIKDTKVVKEDTQSYLACGCGCCGNNDPIEKCLYKKNGDRLTSIIIEDEILKNSTSCSLMGCSRGTLYKYCD